MFNHEGHEDHEGKIIEKTSCASWLISSGSGSARLVNYDINKQSSLK
jgi:hypothetical protein